MQLVPLRPRYKYPTLKRVDASGTVSVLARLGGGPNGLAVGPDGAIWFADFQNFIIQHNPTHSVARGGYEAKTGAGGATGLRWYQLDVSGAPAVAQQSTWAPADGVYGQGSGFVGNNPGNSTFCAWQNTTASTQYVYGANVCCRVPAIP